LYVYLINVIVSAILMSFRCCRKYFIKKNDNEFKRLFLF